MTDRELIEVLITRLEALEKEVSFLRKENIELRERLTKYENPKNSRNSSLAPSKDENRPKKNQSLRRPSGKKPGGQHGHKGRTLEMTAEPDLVINLVPDYCRDCGASLDDITAIKEAARQIVDIPPIKAMITEYRSFGRTCNCGRTSIADFPKEVNAPISYGQNIEGLIGYFHARQYLPFKRMQEVLNDVMGIGISEGGIHYLLERFAHKAKPLYETIRERISVAKIVGSDETGAKVNGDKHWFWVWQNQLLTYIAHSSTRGKAAVDIHFPDGFPEATLVRDGWRPQSGTTAKHHQTCLPHLLRHLEYLSQKYDNDLWSESFKVLLYDAITLSKTKKIGQADMDRSKIIQRLHILLEKPPDKIQKELYTFYKRACRERENLFPFLFVKDVPSDNNASERAIRNLKVKQKISGQFKTEKAAQNFAIIRSVIDTTIKNGMNVLEAMALLAKLKPQPVD